MFTIYFQTLCHMHCKFQWSSLNFCREQKQRHCVTRLLQTWNSSEDIFCVLQLKPVCVVIQVSSNVTFTWIIYRLKITTYRNYSMSLVFVNSALLTIVHYVPLYEWPLVFSILRTIFCNVKYLIVLSENRKQVSSET